MQRIVVVSNRLPFTVVQEQHEWKFKESVGGLATGLSAYLDSLKHGSADDAEYIWVGWPGSTIPADFRNGIKATALTTFRSHPVFLSHEEVENFYQGFCNKTIWPLFHYFPMYAKYHSEYWQQYVAVNKFFCDSLCEVLNPDDLVWIHDYHLMLLPRMLRNAFPNISIGFFLHIPFPAYEIFRLLPGAWRKEILEGLLGADLVGFHTYDYMQYFLRCVLRILGYEHNMGQIVIGDRIVKAGTFPMGIDVKKFSQTLGIPNVQQEQAELRRHIYDTKTILSIDRLDYSKGIIHRLEGFETLLDQHAEWRGKVTLILIVAPSRVGLDHYDSMKRQIEEMVGRVNGKFGTLQWTPIRYQYKTISFEPLVALYSVSDIALITPLRDGMNLIAKEYIASRSDATGVLILSEMAGASKELGEAIIINPNNREEIANALKEALDMSQDEQVRRNTIMRKRLGRYDVNKWANEFIGELRSIKHSERVMNARILSQKNREKLVDGYRTSGCRSLFLDYDGTLVNFTRKPKDAKPTEEVLHTLRSLAENPNTQVTLISGRDKETLEEWFGALPIGLVAEHGAWTKNYGGTWSLIKTMTVEWKQKIQPVLEMYADRLPGAFVEEKGYSLAWHYRAADLEQGEMMARELMDDVVEFTANIDVQVLQGNKVVEVRNAGVNKGLAASQLLANHKAEFVLAIGDDWTDEDLFMAMPETAYTIHVGVSRTHARYNLRNPREVLQLLVQLAEKK
jgi:trehalose 6-phosphate synthase/phosphatase